MPAGALTRRRLLAVFALLAGAWSAAAPAATCTLSATATAFGSYNTLSSLNNDTTGSVSVSCSTVLSLTISYDILLSTGGSGSYPARRMTAGGNTLNYNLYTTALRTTIWGDGTGGSTKVSDSFLLAIGSANRSYTVYGRIPAQQNVPAAGYADSITVTLLY